MPSFNYSKMQQISKKLIRDFGAAGTLTRKTLATADSTKPWIRTVSASPSSSIPMVLVPWSKEDVGRYFEQDIISNTQKALLAGGEADVPLVDDNITFLEKTYVVKAIKPVNPAGTPIVYVCAIVGGQ